MNQLAISKSNFSTVNSFIENCYLTFNFENSLIPCWFSGVVCFLFFRRNFNEELNAQKLVRLVFNGHVLQPDGKTIAACGLFDNCVVHCLIHNPRPNVVTEPNQLANNQSIPLVNEGNFILSIRLISFLI